MKPQRQDTPARDWQEANKLRQLVWAMKGLRGEPKCAWWFLWWDLQLCRGGAVDVTAAQVAHAIGAADAKSGRQALVRLWEAGLVLVHSRAPNDAPGPYRGRWLIQLPDPRDVLIGRRQASDGQGEPLFDKHAERESTEPGSSPVAGRVSDGLPPCGGRAQSAGLATEPGAPPVPDRGSVRTRDVERAAHPPAHAPPTAAHAPAHAPPNGASAGESSDPYLDLKGMYIPDLSLEDLDLVSAQVQVPGRGENRGTSAGTCAAVDPTRRDSAGLPTIGNLVGALFAKLEGRTTALSFSAELCNAVPGLWGDWADLLFDELDGARDAEHGGERTPLTRREVARIAVASVRAVAERRARKPLPVHFTGALNGWLSEHGRKKIFVPKRKPR